VDATIIEARAGKKREDGTSTRDERRPSPGRAAGRTTATKGTSRGPERDRDRLPLSAPRATRLAVHRELVKGRTHGRGGQRLLGEERRARLTGKGIIDAIFYKAEPGPGGVVRLAGALERSGVEDKGPCGAPSRGIKQMGYRACGTRGLRRNELIRPHPDRHNSRDR